MKLFAMLLLAVVARADVAVTVYNNNLGVVKDTRAFELKEGRQALRFTDVAAQIDATSVSLSGPEGFKVLEQNFDYDLLSSDKLLQKYVDQDIQAVGKAGKEYSGRLLSFDGSQLVLKKAVGGIEMLNRNELARMEFPNLPAGLITRPTLVWDAQSPVSGSKPLTLTYMTQGLNWHAEYVAKLAPDEKSLNLNAWVSVDNESGADYADAKLKLIAGEVNRGVPKYEAMRAMAGDAMAAPAANFEQKAFFEYHLYTLARPATLKNAQVKQVELMTAASVPVRKTYRFDGSRGDSKVEVVLDFKNDKSSGLGSALPAGKVRVYKSDSDGSSEFVGEDSLDHTPKDEEVRIQMGKAFDVVGKRTQTDFKQLGDRKQEYSVEVEIRNRKEVAVSVIVSEHAWGEWEILEESLKHRKKDAQTFEFEVPVDAGTTKTVTYRIRVKN